MKGFFLLLLSFFAALPCLGSAFAGDPPFAEISTNDTAWCEQESNISVADIEITGELETSLFDLVLKIRGSQDTLYNLPEGKLSLFLNNKTGRNQYILLKIIEYQEGSTLENDLNDTLVVDVHPLPDMGLDIEYEDLCNPVEALFVAGEGYAEYAWDFGDGTWTITDTSRVEYTYLNNNNSGSLIYDTRFRARTGFGCADSVSRSLEIFPAPVADFSVTPQSQDYPAVTVYLSNLTATGDWSYEWDFGDGSSDNNSDPVQHQYSTWGIFDIVLKTFSSHCSDSTTRQISIMPPPPVADFEPDTSGCPNLEVTFRNKSLYADTYAWDFDDGATSTEANPSHVFLESKDHQVELVATGLSGNDNVTKMITVFVPPVAQFEPDQTGADNLKEEISFINNSYNASEYLWDFGDGTNSEDEHPVHVFTAAGTYTITLYVWDINGCADTLIRESLITIRSDEMSPLFPSAFMWNGSGPTGGDWSEGGDDNTVFHPHVTGATELKMIIFSRLGHEIWKTNELYVGWDGYLESGDLADQGVYIYQAWITYSSGDQELISGDVTFLH